MVLTAYQLLGKVNYFWGGKSLVLGWDSRWGTPMKVTAAGSSSSGNILIIHCASSSNNVVVTGKIGFTTLIRLSMTIRDIRQTTSFHYLPTVRLILFPHLC